jgi:thiol-disulfide isomerase/thioredoxin
MAASVGCARIGARLALLLVLALGAATQAATPAKSKFVALPGTAAPVLELRDTAGKVHRLSDYRGKVVLVNFWATWCEPCREEMPSMQKLRQRMEAQAKGSFVVLAVNYAENEARIGEFLKQQPLDFAVLLDPFSEAWRAWKPGLLPASFLIGRDGRARYRVLGELDWSGAEAATVVTRLVKEGA